MDREETEILAKEAAEVEEFLRDKSEEFIRGYMFAVWRERRNLPSCEELTKSRANLDRQLPLLKKKWRAKLQRIVNKADDNAVPLIHAAVRATISYNNTFTDLLETLNVKSDAL